MNMKKELKEEMMEAIFIYTGGRKENAKIAGICADIAVRFFSSNAVLAVSLPSDVEFEKNLKEYSPYEKLIIRRFYDWIKRGNDR